MSKELVHAKCSVGSKNTRFAQLTDDDAQAYLMEQGIREQLGLDDRSWKLVWEKMARLAEGSIAKLNDLEGLVSLCISYQVLQFSFPRL